MEHLSSAGTIDAQPPEQACQAVILMIVYVVEPYFASSVSERSMRYGRMPNSWQGCVKCDLQCSRVSLRLKSLNINGLHVK